MARVIIEDCLEKVPGHFDLVLISAERAKQISSGRKSDITKKGIKSHVTSLREIGSGVISTEKLYNDIIDRLNATNNDENHEPNIENEIIEEVQTMEFIPGEVEEISISEDSIMFDEEEEIIADKE